MRTLVFIPAKAASQRIPRKNFRLINGKSPIDRTIETALGFSKKSDIYVSSDEQSIRENILNLGVNFISRDPSLSEPSVTNLDVIKKHISDGALPLKDYETVMLLQPTTPFRDARGLLTLKEKFYANPKPDSVVTVVEKRRPYATAQERSGKIQPLLSVTESKMQKNYEITGHAYLISSEILINGNSLLGNNIDFISLPDNWPEIDLDNARDWALAKAYAKYYD